MSKLFISGDVVNYKSTDGLICSSELSEIIKSSDYAICNFEAPTAGYGTAQVKIGPHHSQRAETISGLSKQGFDLLLLANNHIMDFGRDGLKETCKIAKAASIEVVGAGLTDEEAYRPLIKEIDGLRIGIINAAEAQFGVIDYFERVEGAGYAWINSPIIDQLVMRLKKECDYVLVFAHAGLENFKLPQKIWRERYKHLCNLGADAVIGSHPHIPQGYERHNGSLIFYSLGNFYFDGGGYSNSKNQSFAIQLILKKGCPPEFHPVFHETKDGLVCVLEDANEFDLTHLCTLLEGDYSQLHDDMNVAAYLGLQKQLIMSSAPIPTDGTLFGTIKECAATLLGRRKYLDKQLLQLHLFRNESYRYAIQHALEVIHRNKGGS